MLSLSALQPPSNVNILLIDLDRDDSPLRRLQPLPHVAGYLSGASPTVLSDLAVALRQELGRRRERFSQLAARVHRPIANIDITLNPATENSHTPPDLINYEIRFKNRAYYWRYLIINRQDHDLSSPKITSTNPDIAFSDPETIDIPNIPGPVIEIKSTSPIAICENYAFSNELESSLDKFPLPSPDDKNLQVNKDGSYSAYMYVYV